MSRDAVSIDVRFVDFDASSAHGYCRCVSYLIAAAGVAGCSFACSPLATPFTELTVEQDGVQLGRSSSALPSPVALLALGGLAAVLLALVPWLLRKQFDSQKCRVTRTHVEYESGWITHSTQTIPLDRIQDVAVKQGPLQQRFGIWSIEIQTAGSNGPLLEVTLAAPKNAIAVRDAIISYRNALVLGGGHIAPASDPGLVPQPSHKSSASGTRDVDLATALSELTASARRIEALIAHAIQKKDTLLPLKCAYVAFLPMVVTWDAEQLQAATLAVSFGDAHASAWQFYQSKALGTAAAGGAAPSKPRVRLLSLAEAFYVLATCADGGALVAPHALGSLEQLWSMFSAAHPSFQRQCVVQRHFREQGWVLKSGLNYGAHHVLYHGAPDAYHSEYIVYVKEAPELSWEVVQALTRVAADVKKTVLICEVVECRRPSRLQETPTLTLGRYEFVGHVFEFTAIAIRFMDVALPDSAPAPKAGATPPLFSPFAFQPQPVVLKKKRNKKPKKQPKKEPQR